MPFTLRYHPAVRDVDIPDLDARLKSRIRGAIETRLTAAPQKYGEPLRKTLRRYWKLRVEDYRVVYRISGQEVLILEIIHRRDVYTKITTRT